MSAFAAMWSPLLFGFALFLSSGLLFLVQPMIGRTLLPHLGGNPIAWNVCLVYFHATLLAGYIYAGLVHRYRGLRWQPWLQMLLMALATILCFAGVFGEHLLAELAPRLTSFDDWPILSTICLLIVVIGLPFFTLAAVGPLVQRWFAHLDHPKASDPYFLFVASNLGGLMALVIYPLMIEPFAPMYAQWRSWNLAMTALGFVLFVTALCAWRSPRNPELEPEEKPDDPNAPLVPKLIGRGPATWPRAFYWMFASALPVGLLMGLTDYLTLAIAPAPILWTLPLALYLIAFSQSFGRFSPFDYGNLGVKITIQLVYGVTTAMVLLILLTVLLRENPRANATDVGVVFSSCLFFVLLMLAPSTWLWVLQPLSALAVVFVQANMTQRTDLNPGLLLLHLSAFYLTVRLCLDMLAIDRPATPALTTYYTWIGLGGLVGGVVQLLIAPLVFVWAYLEYSWVMALACMLRAAWFSHGLSDWLLCLVFYSKGKGQSDAPAEPPGWIAPAFDIGLALAVAAFTCVAFMARSHIKTAHSLFSDVPLVFALLGTLALFARPWRFGLALLAVVVLCWVGQIPRDEEKIVVLRRTPFGILRVVESKKDIAKLGLDSPRYTERSLMHSSALHGSCITDPPELLRYPTTFYHRKGPVGQVMRNLEWFREPAKRLRGEDARYWLQRNRDNARDDVRIAASLVGAAGLPLDAIASAWSEPPYAFVGLGTGTLFTYAHPFQWVDAYELDPAIIDLSTTTPTGEKTPVFHYFQSAQKRGVNAQILAGDARRSLNKPGRDGFYHVIFIDASSSDSVPMHLLTREAIETYFQKLAPDGIVCFNTTNRYLDLARAVDQTARTHNLSTKAIKLNVDLGREPFVNNDPGLVQSQWLVVARTQEALVRWTSDEAFGPRDGGFDLGLQPMPKLTWTDQYASTLAAAKPNQNWPSLIYGILIMILFFGIFLGLIEISFAMITPATKKK